MMINRTTIQRDQTPKLLGSPAAVGMALVEAHCAGSPWLSPQEAAARARVSDDTARRRLVELVQVGRAVSRQAEPNVGSLYRIAPEIAESIMAKLAPAAPVAVPALNYG